MKPQYKRPANTGGNLDWISNFLVYGRAAVSQQAQRLLPLHWSGWPSLILTVPEIESPGLNTTLFLSNEISNSSSFPIFFTIHAGTDDHLCALATARTFESLRPRPLFDVTRPYRWNWCWLDFCWSWVFRCKSWKNKFGFKTQLSQTSWGSLNCLAMLTPCCGLNCMFNAKQQLLATN